jgi:hypothetical protein
MEIARLISDLDLILRSPISPSPLPVLSVTKVTLFSKKLYGIMSVRSAITIQRHLCTKNVKNEAFFRKFEKTFKIFFWHFLEMSTFSIKLHSNLFSSQCEDVLMISCVQKGKSFFPNKMDRCGSEQMPFFGSWVSPINNFTSVTVGVA